MSWIVNEKLNRCVLALIVMLLLTMLLPMIPNVSFGAVQISDDGPTVFRLLAVEGDAQTISLKSGQFLINALLGFSNWDNSTSDYVSYIHLLSQYGKDEVMDECEPYWVDYSIKANVESEFEDFLASAGSNENVIFYFCGEGSIHTRLLLYNPELGQNEGIYPDELTTWLTLGGLSQANVCVILDSCYSGSWIDDGEEPGGHIGPDRIVLCSSLSNQTSCASPNHWSYFTGHGSYNIGIIAGLLGGANDTDGDGWISFMECFLFAQSSTQELAALQGKEQTPVTYFGIDDIPFVKLTEQLQANFTVTPEKPVSNQTILFNASTSQGIISEYNWDFGDDNETTVSIPTITHRYEQPGTYTVTLTISNIGESNSTSMELPVCYRTDLNKDGTVNIVDLSTVAYSFGTRPGDENWNEIADLDENDEVNILDLSVVAWDFGKTV